MLSKICLGPNNGIAQSTFEILFRTMDGFTMHFETVFVGIKRLAQWTAMSPIGQNNGLYITTAAAGWIMLAKMQKSTWKKRERWTFRLLQAFYLMYFMCVMVGGSLYPALVTMLDEIQGQVQCILVVFWTSLDISKKIFTELDEHNAWWYLLPQRFCACDWRV